MTNDIQKPAQKKAPLTQVFFNFIKGKEIKDIAVPLIEVALDAELQQGIIRDIPIVGTAYKALTAAGTVRDALYERKITKFLFELRDIPEQIRNDFAEKIEGDHQQREKLGLTLLNLIEKADDIEKAGILGQLMAAHIRGDLLFDRTLRLCYMVNNSFLPDLALLYKAEDGLQHAPEITPGLASNGFLRMTGQDYGAISDPESENISYELSIFAHDFIKFVKFS
jgi:hypothetical protein